MTKKEKGIILIGEMKENQKSDLELLKEVKEDILTAMTYSATEWQKRASWLRMATNCAKKIEYTKLLYVQLAEIHHKSRRGEKEVLNLRKLVKMIDKEIEYKSLYRLFFYA